MMFQPNMYGVFLSFRGEGNQANFISHLYSSLLYAGMCVFRDDDKIQQGDEISISLLSGIRQSRICIVVLSTNYAYSRRCMLELEKIMEICRFSGLLVVPVFYEVDPSEVRHQKGWFGIAFENLMVEVSVNETTKSNWRRDLIEIAGKDGFVVTDSRNGSVNIKNIVEHVSRLLDKTDLFVVEYPVGVGSRVEAATGFIDFKNSEDVLHLGIWGMGGIGKTTIAKAIYNKIGIRFEGRSFLLNIREFWETDTNQVSLQQQVLSDVYKTTELKIHDIESGKNILKERLAQKRVLLVLDDVNELDQLNALCGSREWFGPGSRIIITTRDMHLLRSCRVDRVYAMQEMDESESLELFSWHAFKQPSPAEGFATHSTDVIAYSGGLPLALQILGSYLSDREATKWQIVLEKCKFSPHDQVQKMLKVSFDGLKEVAEKQIFLDIACFLIGMDKNDVIQILNGCGYFAEIGIEVLVQQSLVTIDTANKLRMHDLLRDMGRQIIFEESPFDTEKRSRLWRHEEVFDILSKYKGTEAVKGLVLEFPRENCLETKAFKKMNKLRLLRLAEVKLNGDFKYLSGDLRWLYWHGFPETYVPAEFQLGSLVVLELKYSKLKQIWNKSQMLENLKVLNLSHSLDLTETPDFSYMPNLEKLILEHCPSLSTVSHSIGSLHKILLINLTDCTGLQTLPKSIYKLKSLATLILSGCSRLNKLEEDLEQMESLTTLIADKTAIPEVPSSLPKMYDVFLSFRGEDNRARFISHLHSSLHSAGIYAFKDDDGIQRGDQISVSLLQAIERSRISIVVLSRNYANSRWCMLELEKIMEIGKLRGMVVVPVFYEVDPSEVRHQKGQFGKSFEELISTISVDESTSSNWRRQLFDIGCISGFVLIDSRNESTDIKNIVEYVTQLLDRTELFVAEHPVGVESRVKSATELLNMQNSKDVLILGIWGMRGMGKTTLAKAIYNQIGSKFEGRSFVLNIREFWETNTNLVSLQQQVLCDVYKTLTFKIRDIESGKSTLKERLVQNRVLLVLDDVNELEQLKALCGSRKWFGPGSRIIITTIDMHLLRLYEVDGVYTIDKMDKIESLKLFSWHAFKQPSPRKDLATQSTDVIAYSGGLPLALEVLGSYLSDCKITEWHKVLEKLKSIPHDQVQEKLKVSFDGLKDFTQKQIFLDIACFFIGRDRHDVIQILNGCGFFADIGIKVLVERALVTVDNGNKLRMHDLLRDMGRQIINEESPLDPEKRSRLWIHGEVFDILEKHKGTEAIKGLALEFQTRDCLETKAFKKMNKLRLLRLAGVQLKGEFKYLSGDLRWLYWHGFPETYVPAEFQLGSLVVLELKYSKLKQIWNKSQMLENLKILNLSHSLDLTETPDFSYLPNLEKLVLKNCPSLSTVSHSIGSLHKILVINLRDCTGLRKLPRNIYKLKSLETLILSGCSMIEKLEEDIEQMESLTTLIADRTAITKVPFSIVRLKSIGYISLSGFEGFSRDVFPSLVRSWMSPSNNVISLVQPSVDVSSLGTSKDLQKLRILCVECHTDLQLTEAIARFLDVLKATNCENLEASASSTRSEISDMYASPVIDDCLGQVCISRSKNHLKSLLIRMGTKCHVSNIAEDSFLQTTDGTSDSFLLPCDDKFNRLIFCCNGCSIIFDVPTMNGSNLKSMMLFVVYYSSPENITSEGCQGMLIINYTKTTIQAYRRDTLTSFEDEDWQSIISNLEPGNKVKVMVVFGEGFIVKKTTLSLLYDKPVDKEMQPCFVVDEEEVIVSGNDDNNVSVSGGDNEAVNRFGEGFTVNHMLITKRTDGLYADVVGLVQLILHDPDQAREAAAEEIPAAEADCDKEQQVPPTDGQLEQQAEVVAPVGVGPALTQILDALRELKVDFVRLEQTVTARMNAVEVRLEVLEDVITQIPRGSSSD